MTEPGPIELRMDGAIAIITVDSPPVNALSEPVRRGLTDSLARALSDPEVAAIVLICAGRTFIAGADIKELGGPIMGPSHGEVFNQIEAGSKPVVAAIHGSALGGGLEAALICHYRIATQSAKLGFPEVNLGILPGGGGTQRLPRLVGIETALELIATGRIIGAGEALALGLIDIIGREDALREDAVAFARDLVARNRPLRRVRDLQARVQEARDNPNVFDLFREKHPTLFKGFKAPGQIIAALRAAVDLPFDAGMVREQVLLDELMQSREAAAQQYLFFARRAAAKSDPDSKGPIADRARQALVQAAMPLLAEGVSRETMDRVLIDFGFPPDPDRLGGMPKSGAGLDQQTRGSADRHILESLLFPLVNDCARMLNEGIASAASAIDAAVTGECQWPIWTGGPTFWADGIGLDRVVAGLDALSKRFGDAFVPDPLLLRLAQQGRSFQD